MEPPVISKAFSTAKNETRCSSLKRSKVSEILFDADVSSLKVGVAGVIVVFLCGLIVFEVKCSSPSFFFFFKGNSSSGKSFGKSLEKGNRLGVTLDVTEALLDGTNEFGSFLSRDRSRDSTDEMSSKFCFLEVPGFRLEDLVLIPDFFFGDFFLFVESVFDEFSTF